jgi:hypothetical protein
MHKVCPSAFGFTSKKAKKLSSSVILKHGISPFMILVKILAIFGRELN